MARQRDAGREIHALQLRAEGVPQHEVAAAVGRSTRTVARWESRWRRGDRPLPELLAALWAAYDAETHGWRKLRFLQSAVKLSVAAAEVEKTRLLCAALEHRGVAQEQEPTGHKSRSRQVSRQDVSGALDLLDNAINKCPRR